MRSLVKYLCDTVKLPSIPKSGEPNTVIIAEIAVAFRAAMKKSHFRAFGGLLFAFNDNKYAKITKEELLGIVRSVLEERYIPPYYRINVESAVDFIWERATFEDSADFIPISKRMLSFTNGVLEVETGDWHRHSPELGVTIALSYDYSPRAECPRWESIWGRLLPNPADRQMLQDVIGWSLLTDVGKPYWGLNGAQSDLPVQIIDEMRSAIGLNFGSDENGEHVAIVFDVKTIDNEFNEKWRQEMFREEIQGIFGWCYSGYRNVLARGGRVMPKIQKTEIVPKGFGDEKEIWTDAPF